MSLEKATVPQPPTLGFPKRVQSPLEFVQHKFQFQTPASFHVELPNEMEGGYKAILGIGAESLGHRPVGPQTLDCTLSKHEARSISPWANLIRARSADPGMQLEIWACMSWRMQSEGRSYPLRIDG